MTLLNAIIVIGLTSLVPFSVNGQETMDALKPTLETTIAKRDSLMNVVATLDSLIDQLQTQISRFKYQQQLGVRLELSMEGKLKSAPNSMGKEIALIPAGEKIKADWFGKGFYRVVTPNQGEGYLHSVYVLETDDIKVFKADQEVLRESEAAEREAERRVEQGRIRAKNEARSRAETEKRVQALMDREAEIVAKKDAHRKDIAKIYRGSVSDALIRSLLKGELEIGMPSDFVDAILGYPSDRNITKTEYGTSEQWVYDPPVYGWRYVYIRNGVVTGMQN